MLKLDKVTASDAMGTEEEPTLDAVIKEAAARTVQPNFERERVDKYCAAVSALIGDMQGWLKDQTGAGVVRPVPVTQVDRQEHGHSYRVDSWEFGIGNIRVSLEPRGTWVIGAYGRADLVASPGEAVVLTLDKDFQWQLPTLGRTKITYEPLNEQTFPKALKRALRSGA